MMFGAESNLGGVRKGKGAVSDIAPPAFLRQGDGTTAVACAAQEPPIRHLLRDPFCHVRV